MKKLLALLMSVALGTSFVACSSNTSDTTDVAQTDTETYTETVNEEAASDELTLRVYQSGSTVEAMVYGTFIEDFLEVASKTDECQLSVDFETDDGAVFCLNAFSGDGYLSGYYYNFDAEDGDSVDMSYGTSAISFSLPNYTGDFSQITQVYVYRFEGDEYIDGGGFSVADVLTDESFFNGGGSNSDSDSGSDSDMAYVSVDGDTLTLRIEGDPMTQTSYNIAGNPSIDATFKDASGSGLGHVVLNCVEGGWSGYYESFSNGQITSISQNYEGDMMQVSFSISESGIDVDAIAGLSLSINLVDLDAGTGETLYVDDNYAMQLDLGAYLDAQDSEMAEFLEKFVGNYYVYNRNDYTDVLTVTEDTITFIHNGLTYIGSYDSSSLETTYYGENCATFTDYEDNIIVRFMDGGSSAYISIYINYLESDTGEKMTYDYKMEDQVAAVDEAFISEYMGEYFDIESGADMCNLGLYNGGYLGYCGEDGVSYTVDTILGAELVNGNEVNVTLTAADGTTFDASIWFGYSGSALRANVNGGWTMEAID